MPVLDSPARLVASTGHGHFVRLCCLRSDHIATLALGPGFCLKALYGTV